MNPEWELSEDSLFIVTGSIPIAERHDRPLAYHLQQAICRLAELDGLPLDPVVLSDLWYLNYDELHALPVISVGGPEANALSARFYRCLAPALVIDSALMIQLDRKPICPRASIWGAKIQQTHESLDIFIEKGHLREFLDLVADRVPR